MELSLCSQVLYNQSFEQALGIAAGLGIGALELPVDSKSPFIDLDLAVADRGVQLRGVLEANQMTLSALSNHQEGLLLLGPHDQDTDGIYPGNAQQKREYAKQRLKLTAELAHHLGLKTIICFVGCERWSRFFPWPDAHAWDRMLEEAAQHLIPILDYCHGLGVRLAHECHPGQLAYDLDTAKQLLQAVGFHPAFGFNLDPGNLLAVGADPVVFAREMAERIWHVHAKDGERIHQNGGSSLLAQGPWERPGRGFRFRVPGWGDVPWRKLITELHVGNYSGHLAIEHEDPTMGRLEGLQQSVAYLSPLLLNEPREERWW